MACPWRLLPEFIIIIIIISCYPRISARASSCLPIPYLYSPIISCSAFIRYTTHRLLPETCCCADMFIINAVMMYMVSWSAHVNVSSMGTEICQANAKNAISAQRMTSLLCHGRMSLGLSPRIWSGRSYVYVHQNFFICGMF